MKLCRECPDRLPDKGSYFCQILHTTRQVREERICEICELLYAAMSENGFLQHAFTFAAEAHRNQFRKGSQIPYLIHLIRTWGYVRQMTPDGEEQAAALLHDVLEDTEVTAYILRKQFGDAVLDLVVGESEDKREEKPAADTWELRKSETIRRLHRRLEQESERKAMHIALGDKLANLYSMMYEYRQIGDRLWEKFNQKDKKMHGWYYGEMGLIFETYFAGGAEETLVSEYKDYYQEVFGHEISMYQRTQSSDL